MWSALLEINEQFSATVVLTGVASDAHKSWGVVVGSGDGLDQTCCVTALATFAPGPSAPGGSVSALEGVRAPPAAVPHRARTPPVLCGAMAPSRAAPRGGRTLPAHGVAREDFSCPTKAAAASKRASLVPAAQSPPALQGWQGNGPFSSRSRPSK